MSPADEFRHQDGVPEFDVLTRRDGEFRIAHGLTPFQWVGAAGCAAPLLVGSARLGHHDLEIFAGDYQGVILCDIEFVEEPIKIDLKGIACFWIDGCESFEDRPVVISEDLQQMLGRFVAESEILALRADTHRWSKQSLQMCFASPQGW